MINILRPAPSDEDMGQLSSRVTPEEQLEVFEQSTGVTVTARQRELFLTAQRYRGGDLAKLHDAGTINMRPQGPRVLMRAIAVEDASILGMAGEMRGVDQDRDARRCIAHEIVAVGAGVERLLDDAGIPDDTRDWRGPVRRLRAWWSGRGAQHFARPRPGDHVFVLSTVADRASKTDRNVRLWTVNALDISLRW